MGIFKTTKDGTVPVSMNVTNNQGINTPLITFDCIFDTDFGIMLYIDRYFLDTSVFDVDFFNSHHKINEMVKALIMREEKNPLLLCVKDIPNREKVADDLYQDMIHNSKHYKQILELSMLTCVWEFVSLSSIAGSEITPSVICRTEDEKDALLKQGYKRNITMIGDVIDIHQQYYFRYIDDEYTDAISPYLGRDRSIYIPRYKFNEYQRLTDEKSPFLLYSATKFNRLCYYDLYDKSKLFPKEEN